MKRKNYSRLMLVTALVSVCVISASAQLEVKSSGITFSGSELAAGMYFYALIVDGKEVDTKRMVLTE